MAGIVCRQCGYENPEGSDICEICAEELSQAVIEPVIQENVIQVGNTSDYMATTAQIPTVEQIDDGNEYFVLCPESHTKTVLANGKVTKFFCEGCKKEHEIDEFLWSIEKRVREAENNSTSTSIQTTLKGDNLWLEEVNSHFRIDIDKSGGTMGRYGKYGAEFFKNRNMLTVSGEHCSFSYEFGNWVLRHLSRTNQTMYNGMILGANEPNLLEDGKMLVLANTVSFVVRIG